MVFMITYKNVGLQSLINNRVTLFLETNFHLKRF